MDKEKKLSKGVIPSRRLRIANTARKKAPRDRATSFVLARVVVLHETRGGEPPRKHGGGERRDRATVTSSVAPQKKSGPPWRVAVRVRASSARRGLEAVVKVHGVFAVKAPHAVAYNQLSARASRGT